MYKKLALIILYLTLVKSDISYKKCSDNIQCIEQDLIKYVDKIDNQKSIPIMGDMLVLEKADNITDNFSGNGFVDRCISYLTSHELKLKIPAETAREFVEESRKSKLRKILLPILILLKLKAAIIVPAILSAIALVAFKGLGAGLIALAISGAIGLKSLLDGHGGSKLTYEVVPQFPSPHWSRVGLDPLVQGYHTIP